MEFPWFSFVVDDQPNHTVFFPISAITSAVLLEESFTLFFKDGSADSGVAVECAQAPLLLNLVLTGKLQGALKKGAHGIVSVAFPTN